MSPASSALLLAIVGGAFFTEAVAGFGATVLTVAFGASLLPLGVLLPAFVPVNVALCLAILLRHRDAVDARLLLGTVLPWMLLGLPAGVLAFRSLGRVDEGWLKLGFGAFVVAVSAFELARGLRSGGAAEPRPLRPNAARAVLLLGGAVHGAWATGGPMVVYFLGRSGLDKRRFRSTLAALWAALGALLVAGYAEGGSLTAETGALSLAMLPAMLAGLVLGERVHHRISPAAFRRAVAVLLLFGGALLVSQNLPRG